MNALHIRRSPLFQAALMAGFWLTGEAVAKVAHIPLPGGILGLGIVLALLATGRLNTVQVKSGASLLLSDILLFFVPAVLAILDHREFLGMIGLKILFVILMSTVAVMLVTALSVDCCSRWRNGHVRVEPSAR